MAAINSLTGRTEQNSAAQQDMASRTNGNCTRMEWMVWYDGYGPEAEQWNIVGIGLVLQQQICYCLVCLVETLETDPYPRARKMHPCAGPKIRNAPINGIPRSRAPVGDFGTCMEAPYVRE